MATRIGSVEGSVNISVTEAINGLRQLSASLRQTAASAGQAGTQIGTAFDGLGAKVAGAGQAAAGGLRNAFASAKTAVAGEAQSMADSFKGALGPGIGATIGMGFGMALAGAAAAAIGALQQTVTKFIDTGVAIGKLQQSTGMAATELSALARIAEENEISFESFRSSMSRFSRTVFEMQGPTANVQAELMKLADRFKAMPDGPEKAALAMEMFGRQGEAMIPILSQGSAALEQYSAELAKAGLVMNDSMVAAANRADDALDKLGRSQERIGIQIGDKVVPAYGAFIDVLAQAMANTEKYGLAALDTAGIMQAGLQVQANYAAEALNVASATDTATAALNATALAAARAYVAYGQLRAAESARLIGIAETRSAGAALGNDEQKWMDRNEVQLQKIRLGNTAYADRQRALQNTDMEQRRALNSTRSMTDADAQLNAWLEQVNASFEGRTASAGGAARATRGLADETRGLADAQQELERRTQGIGSAMGQSLEPMSASQRFQMAWKVATGETTIAQLQQEAAVKGVMKALDAGSISQEDALATLLSLRAGLLDNKGAMDQAGQYAGQFAADVEAIQGVAAKSIEKVQDLSKGINTLPSKTVTLGMQIIGADDLLDAHTRWSGMQNRTVRLNVEVLGMDQLAAVWAALYGGSPPVGTPRGATGGTGSTGSAGSTGTTDSGGDYGGDGGGGRKIGGRSSVNVVFNGRVLATAMTDDTTVRGVRGNQRRSYR